MADNHRLNHTAQAKSNTEDQAMLRESPQRNRVLLPEPRDSMSVCCLGEVRAFG
jgi:hypothetical protein